MCELPAESTYRHILFALLRRVEFTETSMQMSATQNRLETAARNPTSNNLHRFRSAALAVAAFTLAASCSPAIGQTTGGVHQVTNILSDGYVPATNTDPNFVDPWGVAGTKTLWIDTAVTGYSYVVPIVTPAPPASPVAFKAVVPPAPGTTGAGQPTGIIQNTTTGFILSNGAKASFLFATLDGTISGWNSATSAGGNNALIAVNNNAKNAVYTDMALVTNATGSFLLLPNFGAGASVEVYNTTFQLAPQAGSFADPNIPAGYAPYAVKVIGTQVFVTYMLRGVPPASSYQETLGTNTGFVSVFDVNGNFVARAVTGGLLNAPWGVAIAPAGFGIYAGDLLIGNFGDGLITAYNPTTYAYLGTLADGTGKAIAYPGLWDIFANANGNASALYFTAGLANETHGLFGSIANVTTATSTPTFNLSSSSKLATVAVGGTTTLTLSLAPTNSFSGTVSLTCTGLPSGAACDFAAPQIGVLPNAPTITTVTIATQSKVGSLTLPGLDRGHASGIVAALLLPFGALLVGRRRKPLRGLRLATLLGALFVSAGLMSGCSTGLSIPATPTGTSNVTITATSGSLSHSTMVALTVQ